MHPGLRAEVLHLVRIPAAGAAPCGRRPAPRTARAAILTFATVGLFDAHRWIAGNYGSCRDPTTLTYRAGQRAGERVMFWRDGLWWAPEITGEGKVAAFGERAS